MGIKKQIITSFSNVPKTNAFLYRPEKISELEKTLFPCIARGCGKSYGDAPINTDKNVVLMERLNRFLEFNHETGILRAEAGCTLEDILNTFVPKGWFLPVTPGTKKVTLGGCLSADVHGKNHHIDGSFSEHVDSIEIMRSNGARLKANKEGLNSDLFQATTGGMGLTGIITEMTLRMKPIETAYILTHYQACPNLEETLNALRDENLTEKYSVAWIDCLASNTHFGRGIVINGRHLKKDECGLEKKNFLHMRKSGRKKIPFYFPNKFINPFIIKAFNAYIYASKKKKSAPFIEHIDPFFYPLDSIDHWNRIYGKRGFLQYQVVLPEKDIHMSLKTLLDRFQLNGHPSFLAVLKRFGKQSQGHLSFPMPGYTLALDLPYTGDDLLTFLDEMDEIVLKFGGRVYLAKDYRLKPETFKRMYPKLKEWLIVKQKYDPDWKFQSDLSRRLLMEKGS